MLEFYFYWGSLKVFLTQKSKAYEAHRDSNPSVIKSLSWVTQQTQILMWRIPVWNHHQSSLCGRNTPGIQAWSCLGIAVSKLDVQAPLPLCSAAATLPPTHWQSDLLESLAPGTLGWDSGFVSAGETACIGSVPISSFSSTTTKTHTHCLCPGVFPRRTSVWLRSVPSSH